ncbi:hypothetical protein Lste_0201 [Legionella steelei]|uniref:Uncharacterized protein n=1 Tax=Legionella steelei TaxID=947033 RepID=A0A0W0ZQH8_9GAMM|nr:hypothetical protein [Legionella steelei]KTD71435.1 hypothetical protein Lste_0201 [Legionella steelei]
MANNLPTFRFESESSTTTKIEAILGLIKYLIPKSSTRESLKPDGYPESGEIEQTIRAYQNKKSSLYEQGLNAMETGCGNCQEMASASGLLLRAGGFSGKIQIAEFGINHAFLIVDDYIVDPWSDTYFSFSTCGSIKEGIMKGRVLSADHFELEDEEPEVTQTLPLELDKCLPSKEARTQLMILIEQAFLKSKQPPEQPTVMFPQNP